MLNTAQGGRHQLAAQQGPPKPRADHRQQQLHVDPVHLQQPQAALAQQPALARVEAQRGRRPLDAAAHRLMVVLGLDPLGDQEALGLPAVGDLLHQRVALGSILGPDRHHEAVVDVHVARYVVGSDRELRALTVLLVEHHELFSEWTLCFSTPLARARPRCRRTSPAPRPSRLQSHLHQ
eukprot:1163845-Pyramimonas_sp.AAC.1